MADGAAIRPPGSAATPGSAGEALPHDRRHGGRDDVWSVRRLASIDSTNRWLMDAAREGAPTGTVAVAERQDAGRGRRGRSWESAPGESLLVSVLLRPQLPTERLHVVTIAAALALAEAVARVAGVHAVLKWPNDLLVGDRKLAGLLAEADLAGATVRAVVVGAGCNLGQRSFPPHLSGIATSCAIETGTAPPRDAILEAFLDDLSARLADLDRVVTDYRDRLVTLGRAVRVELEDQALEGTATDVDADGRLVITRPAGDRVVVAAGDVVHLRS